jgi:hypothetical protein
MKSYKTGNINVFLSIFKLYIILQAWDFIYVRWLNFTDLLYDIVPIVNSTSLCT